MNCAKEYAVKADTSDSSKNSLFMIDSFLLISDVIEFHILRIQDTGIGYLYAIAEGLLVLNINIGMLYLVYHAVCVFVNIGKVGIDCRIYVLGTVVDVFGIFRILFLQFVAVFGKGEALVHVA